MSWKDHLAIVMLVALAMAADFGPPAAHRPTEPSSAHS